jgi:hypothetical protein
LALSPPLPNAGNPEEGAAEARLNPVEVVSLALPLALLTPSPKLKAGAGVPPPPPPPKVKLPPVLPPSPPPLLPKVNDMVDDVKKSRQIKTEL